MIGTGKIISLIKSIGATKKDISQEIQTQLPGEVSDWLDEHITNPDSPPLDRSLLSSSSAAPADMVGDLKSAFELSQPFDATTITGTKLEKVGFYNNALVNTTSWDNPSGYTVNCYDVNNVELVQINISADRKYGFSNYTYSSGLGMDQPRGTAQAGETILENSNGYKYLYVQNSVPAVPEGTITVKTLVPANERLTEAVSSLDSRVTAAEGDIDDLQNDVGILRTNVDEIQHEVFTYTAITGTKLEKVCVQNNVLYGSTGYYPSHADDYSFMCYQIDGAEEISINVSAIRYYAFCNYAYSSGLGMSTPRGNTLVGETILTNENHLKYLYVQNSTTAIPEGTITVNKLSSNIDNLQNDVTQLNGKTDVIKTIYVAASDASQKEKDAADYVCDGTNDEVEIQAAFDDITDLNHGIVRLSTGNFYIDSFPERTGGKKIAVNLAKNTLNYFYKELHGVGYRLIRNTIIHVTETALTALGNDVGYVFSTGNFVYSRVVDYSGFRVYLNDNQHKVTVIDNTVLTGGICKDLNISAVPSSIANTNNTPMPSENCVGITGYCGDDSGIHNQMINCFTTGFYEGFRLGGEHLVCINLGARYNYYAYTFGNYDWNIGTQSHPITMINCCDEHSAALPKFVRCGNYDQEAQKAKMQIDMIGFNMEVRRPQYFGSGLVTPAEEVTPGAFCGRIEFTAYMDSNVSGKSGTGVVNNPNIQFWQAGSGILFETKNMIHPRIGTSSERDFTPMLNQQYFDTTLNKLLVFDGSNWRDAVGNVVD